MINKIIFFCAFFFCFNSFALSPETRLVDEQDELRAMKLFAEIRCLVCEAQSIESSNTEFSASLRKIIREKIAQNKTSEEIKNELQNEFGDQILMSAEIKSEFIIWILPFIFGLILAFFLIRKFIKFSK